MSTSRTITHYPFHGFTEELNQNNQASRARFSDQAKSWLEELMRKCERHLYMGKADTFDCIVNFLQDEAEEWFNKEFTQNEKFGSKNLKNLSLKFRDRYV